MSSGQREVPRDSPWHPCDVVKTLGSGKREAPRDKPVASMANRQPELSHRQGTLIVDDEGKLAGIITRGDLVRALDKSSNAGTVLEAGSPALDRHLSG